MSDPAPPSAPGDEPELWSFSAWFPPPYRVLLLASIGLLLFAANVHILHTKGIDLFALFRADEQEKRRQTASNSFHRSTTGAATQYGSYHNTNRTPHEGNGAILPTTQSTVAGQGGITTRPLVVFGAAQLAWALAGWASYRFYVDSLAGDPKGRHAQALQGFAVAGAAATVLWPGNLFFKPMRKSFGRALLLILTPSLSQVIPFSHVVLADILTSFAKVLGDVWLTACFLVPRKEHHTWWNGKGSIAVPLLISLPYAVRLRQCLSEYATAPPAAVGGWKNKRPLWNAAKYASALPVIWLSAWYEADTHAASRQADWISRYTLWLLAVGVNSIFSFWWDVTNDWGLSLLIPANMGSLASVANNATNLHRRGVSYAPLPDTVPMGSMRPDEKPAGSTGLEVPSIAVAGPSGSGTASHGRSLSTVERMLRPTPSLMFAAWMYQLAIVLDLGLRFLWSLKLSSHLHHLVEWQGGVFSFELLEIVRRSVWVLFRVEWEVVRRRESARPHVALD